MNWKKFLITAMCAISVQTTAFAHGELWYDATSRFAQLKDKGKIIVYPLEYEGQFLIKKNEDHEFYKANDYFNKRFVRKLKVNTV